MSKDRDLALTCSSKRSGKLLRRLGIHVSPPIWLAAAVACLAVFAAGARTAIAQGDNKPKGRIELSEFTFDFGYMPQNGTFAHVFKIQNVGKGTLNIVNIQPTCGCTSVPLERAFLKPGESADVRVNFESGKFKDNINKRIKVLSTDPDKGLVDLYVLGNVGNLPKSVELSGPIVSFEGIETRIREVRIKNVSLQKLTLSVLPISDGFLEATINPANLGPQAEATLTLRLKGNPPLGEYKSSVTIESAGEKTERFSIPIKGIGYAR